MKPYKYTKTTTLLAARKKQQLLQLQIWKKTYFWSIEVGWYKELEVKEFCHFDYIDLQLFNGLFQNNYFKKYVAESKVTLHVFKVSVFVTSLAEPWSFCLFDYYRKIKESSHSLYP